MKRLTKSVNRKALEETAYHEAGHAVARIVLKRYHYECFDKVRVFPLNHRPGCALRGYKDVWGNTLKTAGVVEGTPYWSPISHMIDDVPAYISRNNGKYRRRMLNNMCREIAVIYAGPAAEFFYMGELDDFAAGADCLDWMQGAEGDREFALRVLQDYTSATGRNPERQITRNVVKLVQDEWHSIDAVARRLMVKHSLDYAEVLAIVKDAESARYATARYWAA